ncbi:MAG TPA: DUF2384 domain-containing protein [Oscillatoriaceae cyanobacterium M33_DOE_052]|uniref:DUF2384 domain-containing protein n=1 Tax=Planktothricoides sp. SpSt-374 TaxID=2282167 RepID=A0A7C3ZN75_9CYAN|nr:DUF2384 domain-containing protein [Oscillatoriaceae cyanobacterium M33_DOE_052]
MNTEKHHQISQEDLMCEAFRVLLEKPPLELSDSIGQQGFLEIANFLTTISPPEDQFNPSTMVNHIGAYCYQPGNEVLKKWYLKTYQGMAKEDIQTIVKKNLDAGDRSSINTLPDISPEGIEICQLLQRWAQEIQQRYQPTNQKLMERLAELLGGTEEALIWLKSPHPVLDNRTPESYVKEGKLEVLEYFIHAIETGQPS